MTETHDYITSLSVVSGSCSNIGDCDRFESMASRLSKPRLAWFQLADSQPHLMMPSPLNLKDSVLRRRFGLKGSVKFENHSNTFSPDRTTKQMQSLSLSDNPRRSERLRAHANKSGRTDSSKSSKSVTRSSRPRADQFCVYNTGGEGEAEHRVTALTIEYKAPHKLTSGHI